MGNRKSAAWPSWSVESSSQGPGEDKVKTTLVFVHCSLLEHHALPYWCPYLPRPREPPRAWSQLTAGSPHPLTLPLELGQDGSKTEMEVLKGPLPEEGRVGRAMRGPSGDPHSGTVQRLPPPSPPSLQTRPECREPRAPQETLSLLPPKALSAHPASRALHRLGPCT